MCKLQMTDYIFIYDHHEKLPTYTFHFFYIPNQCLVSEITAMNMYPHGSPQE